MFEESLPPEKLKRILDQFRSGLETLLGNHLAAVYLYGSQARGDAAPDSDVDVLILLQYDFDYGEMIKRTSLLTSTLSLENDVVISRVFATKEAFEKQQLPFFINVHNDAIRL